MRKTITFLFAFTLFCFSAKATTVIVEVEDYEFNPSIFTVNVGDTITWLWQEGYHTTTSATIPAGATAWDQTLSVVVPSYSYVVTVAGSYDYACAFHASMGMLGHFTANPATAVDEVPALPFLNIKGNGAGSETLIISYGLPKQANVALHMYDIIGNPVKVLAEREKPAGLYEEKLSIDGIAGGIYIIELANGDSRVSKKIMIRR